MKDLKAVKMDLGGIIRGAAKPAALMIILAVFGELISAYIGILGIAAFVLKAIFILIAGAYASRKTGQDELSSGIMGALLGLVCAWAGSAARWMLISVIPTGFAPSLADAAGLMVADAVLGCVFWVPVGFILGAIGALLLTQEKR